MATIDLGKIKINWRGTYNNGTAYAIDDAVEYADGGVTSSFICTAASTGNAPSSSGTVHGSWDYMAKGAAASPTTTRGDIIYRGASADARLAKGTQGHVLTMGANDPSWAAAAGGEVKDWKFLTSTTGYSRSNDSDWAHFSAYDLTYTPTTTGGYLLCNFTCMLEMQYGNAGGAAAAMAVKVSTDGGSSYSWFWPSFIANTHDSAPSSFKSGKTCTSVFVYSIGNSTEIRFQWFGVTNTFNNTSAWFGRAASQPADDGQTNFTVLELGPAQ